MFRLLRRISPALAACGAWLALSAYASEDPLATDRPDLLLMGTVPIYWGEASGFDELLGGEQAGHWLRPVIERRYDLVPVDFLTEEVLADRRFLLMAQPRALAPSENVALDAWVRGGGKLLLLADPMMTGESRFALGDRRRPQDVALLSPILSHWGLELLMDDDQLPGLREIPGQEGPIPVNLAGHFALAGETAACSLSHEAVVASCRLGTGRAIVIADAALVDFEGPHPHAESAIEALMRRAFSETGEIAGRAGRHAAEGRESAGNLPSSPHTAAPVSGVDPP